MNLADWHASGAHVDLCGRRIFVRVEGRGPWLTLLHGFPTSSWDFAPIAPLLAPHRRLLMIDFLGYGASEKPRGHRYTIDEQADLVEALWRHHHVTSTEVVAHDYGGTVAEELLARRETRPLAAEVERVTFLNGALIGHLNHQLLIQDLLRVPGLGWLLSRLVTRGMFARSFRKVFSPAYAITDVEIDQHWRAICLARGNRLYHRLVHHYGDHARNRERWEGVLARTTVPAQLIWGMADPVSGADMVAYLRAHAPRLAVHELAGVRHYPHIEVPDVVAAGVLAGTPSALHASTSG